MRCNVDNLSLWVERITQWTGRQRDVFYLSSCNQPDACHLGEYELIVGVGIADRVVVEINGTNCREVARLSDQFCWKFFVISYDYDPGSSLPGKEPSKGDELDWPKLYMVQPEHVVVLRKTGALEIISEEDDGIYAELESLNGVSPANYVSIQTGEIRDSISQHDYFVKIHQIKEAIRAGTFYEMNLCIESCIDDVVIPSPFSLHQQLLRLSPTPFSSYVQLANMHLLCASPERYVRKCKKKIYSQPIKGTSARHRDTWQDQRSKMYLASSTKERAEHVMIVDLVRNDLGRICKTGSVRVDDLYGIYGYRQVYQMISTISGTLEEDTAFNEVLAATFPMGSMTGAPKITAMAHINSLEPVARGWFSGSVGYIAPNGDFDANVVIRGIFYDSRLKKATFSVGSAITYDSNAAAEYKECQLKSRAIRELLQLDSGASGDVSMCKQPAC